MAKQPVVPKEKEIPSVTAKRVRYENLKRIEPLTKVQEAVFKEYNKGQCLNLHGCAGTGKSFLAIYLALKEILLKESQYDKMVIVRSAVPTRDVGFLPGDIQEKTEIYELPYHAIFRELMVGVPDLVEKMKSQGLYQFMSSSYIRGITLHKAIVIVDESENMTLHELSSIVTRLGDDCKIIFCGDLAQSDLHKSSEKKEYAQFMSILDKLHMFSHIEFGEDDIVRSELVKAFIIAKNRMGL
jgi:phosphate starvation-inducible protein PhoH